MNTERSLLVSACVPGIKMVGRNSVRQQFAQAPQEMKAARA